MTAIISIDEPRPRGTVFGERADRRRVGEAEHFFRCKICGGRPGLSAGNVKARQAQIERE